VEIFVRDVSGKLLYQMKAIGTAGENETQLNLANYSNGLYLLQLQSGEQNVIRKVVKQ